MVLEMISVVLAVALLALVYMVMRHRARISYLESMIDSLNFDKKSLSVKYGKMSEQFIPFSASYPYDSQNFRFIGSPIDGVQFESDKVVFVEFKTGDSRLSARQESIRDLIEGKKVEFREIRISQK